MATYHHPTISGDLAEFIGHVDAMITGSSVTAQLEAETRRSVGDAHMVVRAYERYSFTGSNRLTLTIAVLSTNGTLEISAITSGGSTGMFWKINTFGEDAFLQRAVDAITSYSTTGTANAR